jgi:archaellum biogenesis protein FlaJ (TadC family)
MITPNRTKHKMKMLFDRDYPEKYKRYLETVREFNDEFTSFCFRRWITSIPFTLVAANVLALILDKPVVLLYSIPLFALIHVTISAIIYIKNRHKLYCVYTK